MPAGVCERVVAANEWSRVAVRDVLRWNRGLGLDDLFTAKTLRELDLAPVQGHAAAGSDAAGAGDGGLQGASEGSADVLGSDAGNVTRVNVLPEIDKYGTHTWERSVHVHTHQGMGRLGHWLLMWAQANDDHVKGLELALQVLKTAVALDMFGIYLLVCPSVYLFTYLSLSLCVCVNIHVLIHDRHEHTNMHTCIHACIHVYIHVRC